MFFFDRHFLADLASLGSKLMKKKKKPSPYVKWFPRGRSRGGWGGANIILFLWAG